MPSWCERALRVLLPAFAFALPISIALAEPLAFLVVFLWVADLIRQRRLRSVVGSPLFWPAAAFLVIALLASAFGVRPEVSFSKSHRLILVAVCFAVADACGRKTVPASRLIAWFVAACALRGLYQVGVVLVALRRGADLFDTGSMRDPQMYMVALVFLLAGHLQRERWAGRIPAVLGLVASAAGLVLNFKRGAWFAFILVAVLMTTFARRWRILLFTLAAAVLLALIPQTRERLAMLGDEMSSKMGGRQVLWTQVAPVMLREYPFGMGYAASRNTDFVRHAPRVREGLHHLHNNVLQVLLETGWPGLCAWLWWMGGAIFISWQAYRNPQGGNAQSEAWLAIGTVGALAGLLANGVVEYNFGDSEILMLLYFVMGIGMYCRDAMRRRGGGDAR